MEFVNPRPAVYDLEQSNAHLGVYPLRPPLVDNAPRGQRGLARPSKAGLTCEARTSRSRSGACEEHGATRATEDYSLDTLRDPLYAALCSLPERGHSTHKANGGETHG